MKLDFSFRLKKPKGSEGSAGGGNPFSGFLRKVEGGMVQLDKALGERKSSELMMIYAMPVLLLGALAVQFVIPAAEKAERKSALELKNVEQNIKLYEGMVTSRKEGSAYILDLKQKNQLLRDAVEKEKRQAGYIGYRLASARELGYDRHAWSGLLDRLAEEAERRELLLGSLSNEGEKTPPAAGVFGRQLTVTLEGTGGFRQLLEFMAFAESYGLLTVEESRIEGSERGDGSVLFTLVLGVWGVAG